MNFGAILGPADSEIGVASRCGLEQEFYVYKEGRQVDFRDIIHSLDIPGARIDPGDRNAYRMRDGSLVTADGTEAEIATVPVDVVPGFAGGLAALAASLTTELRRLIPPDLTFFGAATHINVSVPSSEVDALVLEYPRVFGPALQALWDRPWGEGLMIRPRPGRIEFGGEFIAGSRLAVVALFCCASIAALSRRRTVGLPRFQPDLEPTEERLGIQFRRTAYSFAFYRKGREAVLATDGAGEIRLADALIAAYRSCEKDLEDQALPGERNLLERIVDGGLPLGIESGTLPPLHSEEAVIQRTWSATPLDGWTGGETTARPLCDTWDYTVVEIARGAERWLLTLPRPLIPRFQLLADSGGLEALEPERLRPLTSRTQLSMPGAFARIPDKSILAPFERAPGSGWRAQRGVRESVPSAPVVRATPAPPVARNQDRPMKIPLVPPARPEEPRVRPFSSALIVLGLIVLVLVAIGIGVFLAEGGNSDPAEHTLGSPSPAAAETPRSPRPSESLSNASVPAASESPVPAVTTVPPANGGTPATVIPGNVSPSLPSGVVSPAVPPIESPGVAPTPTPTNTPVTPTITPTPTSLPAVLSGNRTVAFQVSANPGSHPCTFTTAEMNFLIQRAGPPQDGTPITIIVTGLGVTMSGSTVFGPSFNSQGGNASASGTGTYCNFTTSYAVTFTISPSGVTGTLVIGGDHALPGGEAITFTFSGGPPH